MLTISLEAHCTLAQLNSAVENGHTDLKVGGTPVDKELYLKMYKGDGCITNPNKETNRIEYLWLKFLVRIGEF